MALFQSIALAMLLIQPSLSDKVIPEKRLRGRRLSFENIAGYYPFTQVTDHNAIDLDQAALESQLGLNTDLGFENAKAVYLEGGHSKSYAELTLSSDLSSAITKGDRVTGEAVDGSLVEGKVTADVSRGSRTIKITYITSDILPNVRCQVGALSRFEAQVTGGCFEEEGQLTIGSKRVRYSYDVNTDNKNARTLSGFSTAAESKMYGCSAGCPMLEYMKFYNYYGAYDYADQMILAAFDKTATSFTNGNSDFTESSFVARDQAIKKGIPYMNVYMYVIRELESSLSKCEAGCLDCNEGAMHAWDEGVAFYTGTLEGEDGEGSGKLLYALADKRCGNYKTCGENKDSLEGTSYVNIEMMNDFNLGLQYLYLGECGTARNIVDKIVDNMAVPMIQGALRYAYKVDKLGGGDKEKAEGAAFSLAVLPRLAACSEKDAETVYENMGYNARSTVNFAAVKRAFENNYRCMQISCDDIGGLWDGDRNRYYQGFSPC